MEIFVTDDSIPQSEFGDHENLNYSLITQALIENYQVSQLILNCFTVIYFLS